MAKGGRYLNANQKTDAGKKKGRGWKIALIVLLILALLIGGIAMVGMTALDSILDRVNRAEFVEQTISEEDLDYYATFNYDNID